MRKLRAMLDSYNGLGRDALASALEARLEQSPRCAPTRYLLGCVEFDRGRPATAVRHLMIAQHAEPRLQSSALLVFAGLNWIERRSTPFLAVLLDTWDEFRRPQFDVYRYERYVLDRLTEAAPQDKQFPPLAQRLWRLPIRMLRAQIRDTLELREIPYPLLVAHA